MIKTIAKLLINTFIHPVFTLLIASILKVSVRFHKVDVFINHIPYLFHTYIIETGIRQDLWCPARVGSRKKMQSIAELGGSQVRFVYIISVSFVDNNAVRHFHDTALNTLKFITCACQLNQQEEIYHRVHSRFTLPHSHCLYKNLIETGGFTKNDRFTGFSRYTTQRTR